MIHIINSDGAPNRDNLRRLFKQLPGMVKLQKKSAAKHALKATLPRQFCAICAKPFDLVYRDKGEQLKKGICPDCKQQLDDGCFVAVGSVDDKRFAFLKPNEKQQDMAGKIVPVDKETMDMIFKQKDSNGK
jgi:hypothetical protein